MIGARFKFGAGAVLLSVLATTAVPALSAQPAGAAATDPGITSSTITVGQIDTLSGPVPGLFAGAKYGTQAYLSYINSQGGVNGRKIKLNAQDDSFSGANYASDAQSLVNQTFALVGGFSLFDSTATSIVTAAKIPNVAVSLTSEGMSQYNYSPDPLIVGGSRLGPLTYYKKHFGDAYKHVGTIYTNVSTAAQQSQAVLSAMKSLGYQITYQRVATPFDTNFLSDVIKMRAAGVQMVYIVGLAVNQVADLAQAMGQQNFVPKVFSTNGVAYDSSYIKLAGSAANGTLTDQQSAMYLGEDAKSTPAVKTFDKWFHKVNPGKKIDTYALYGWTSAQLFVQALKAAGPNPTRTSLIAQLNKITSFNAGGLLANANPAQKVPEMCWIMVKVVNGKWVRTSPSPKTGFVCNPGGYHYPAGYKPFVRSN
jgi:ABC-type branched-subunit amino acid transport system substrate-binding protein